MSTSVSYSANLLREVCLYHTLFVSCSSFFCWVLNFNLVSNKPRLGTSFVTSNFLVLSFSYTAFTWVLSFNLVSGYPRTQIFPVMLDLFTTSSFFSCLFATSS